jgi:dihydrofolate reductase
LKHLEDEERIFVIGGSTIFAQTLPLADELRLTLLERDVEGDALFPPYEEMVARNFHLENEERFDGFRFVDYIRTRTAPI